MRHTQIYISFLLFCLVGCVTAVPVSARELDFGTVAVGKSMKMTTTYQVGSSSGIASIPCQKGEIIDRLDISGPDEKDFKIDTQNAMGLHHFGNTFSITILFIASKTTPENATLNLVGHAVDPKCGLLLGPCELIGNPPVLHILTNGYDVTGKTRTVLAGQKISLLAKMSDDSDLNQTLLLWHVPTTIISDYVASRSRGEVVPMKPKDFTLAHIQFYWIDPVPAQVRQVTCECRLKNGGKLSATASFVVDGPTSVSMNVVMRSVDKFSDATGWYTGLGRPVLGYEGIVFTVQPKYHYPVGYPGIFRWVQIINKDEEEWSNKHGSYSLVASSGFLDGREFPYGPDGFDRNDSPYVGIDPAFPNFARTFSARMYLMWGSGMRDSQYIPLGFVDWQFSYTEFINTANILEVRPISNNIPRFEQSLKYPEWPDYMDVGDPGNPNIIPPILPVPPRGWTETYSSTRMD